MGSQRERADVDIGTRLAEGAQAQLRARAAGKENSASETSHEPSMTLSARLRRRITPP
jgi:hypothetical protein